MAQQHELNAAYYQGLREMNGVDPAVAEDLGIPMSPEASDRHVESGRQVGYVLTRAQELPPSPAADAMRTWIAGATRDDIGHDIRGAIAKQVKSGEIRADEVDGLYGLIAERKESFKHWPA
jgi:hypothetical protein